MAGSAVAGLAPVVSIFDRRRVGGELEQARSKAWIAAHFDVSGRTVERWMYEPRYRRGGRQVPFEKRYAGGDVKFRLSEVAAWLGEEADRG